MIALTMAHDGGARPLPDGGAAASAGDAVNPANGAVVTVTGAKVAPAFGRQPDTLTIADMLDAETVRALPDNTVVEALRRLPGVSVLPTSDSEHARDEATSPVIRGLGAAYNNVTVDGSPLASAGGPNGNLRSMGRGARLDLLPSSMIEQLVVNKTFSADLDPNAIGGAIDIRTRSAFDRSARPFFTIEGAGGTASGVSRPRPQDRIGGRLAATGGFTFGPEQRYGLVLAANYQQLDTTADAHMTTDTVSENFYDDQGRRVAGANTGNGRAVPQQDKYWYMQNSRTRAGVTVKADARPSAGLSAFVTGGYYRFRDRMERNENLIDPRNTATVARQTANSGTYGAGAVEVGYSWQQITSATSMLQSGVDWKPAPDQSLGLRANVSRATYREPIVMIKYATNASYSAPGSGGSTPVATPEYGFDYDTSTFNHSFNVAPSAWNRLANYKLLYYRPDYARAATDTIANVRADYRYEPKQSGFGVGAGVAYTLDRPKYNIYRYELVPNTGAPALTLASVIGPTAPLWYNRGGLGLLTIDPARAAAQIAPLQAAGAMNVTDQRNLSNQDNFEHSERTLGAYLQGDYTGERLRARLGLRSDATRQETVGRALVAGSWTPLPSSSRYHFLLPSAQAGYRVSDAVDVRAAASQTIGRPGYDAYAARSAISFVNAADAGNPNAAGVTVTVGNPDIRPRRSTNTDIALDYRLPAGGVLSLAAFNKDIKDEIFDTSSVGYRYQNVSYANAVVTQPVNAAAASVKGLEASVIVNSLAWLHPALRGVGFSANATIMDGRMTVLKADKSTRALDRLVGQPDRAANLSVFFLRDGLELRAAYNYQGRALRSIVPDIAWQDLYWASRAQVDLQASYGIGPELTVFGQVQNVGGSRMTSYVGPGRNLLKDTFSVPTTVWLGLRYTPRLAAR